VLRAAVSNAMVVAAVVEQEAEAEAEEVDQGFGV
jgi:hypothetical protein